MRIGVLTSSRADYGIYLPLLKELQKDDFFELKIIAFGTHLSPHHGYTLSNIENDGFSVEYTIDSMLIGDSPNSISTAMALTSMKFADFWKEHHREFDLVFCLGDRYEMFAAVSAGIPFEIKYAHLHGGETTLGAIDNIFRHSITIASAVHFCSTIEYAERIKQLIKDSENIYSVGALSLDNLKGLKLLTMQEFKKKYKIDLSVPTILFTFHPETVNSNRNSNYAETISKSLNTLSKNYQIVITLPNADTNNQVFRNNFIRLTKENQKIICVENFGTLGYFSCMKNCSFLLGNTSSGIIEAASLNKYVINLGYRQKGRLQSKNVYNCDINFSSIIELCKEISGKGNYEGENIYYQEGAVKKIISVLKAQNQFI